MTPRGRPHNPPRTKIDALLKSSGVPLSVIAERTGVSIQTVQNWANGTSKPDLTNAGKLAGVLGISLGELVNAFN